MTKTTKAIVLALTAAALFAFGLAIGYMVPRTAEAQQRPTLAPSGPTWNSWQQVVPQPDGTMVVVPRNVFRDPYTSQTQIVPFPQTGYQQPSRHYQPAPQPRYQPRPLLRPLGRQ